MSQERRVRSDELLSTHRSFLFTTLASITNCRPRNPAQLASFTATDSRRDPVVRVMPDGHLLCGRGDRDPAPGPAARPVSLGALRLRRHPVADPRGLAPGHDPDEDRKSTRLN